MTQDHSKDPLPIRKRKMRSESEPIPQEQCSIPGSEETAPRKKVRLCKEEKLDTTSESPQQDSPVVLASEMDNNFFFFMSHYPKTDMRAIRNLEVHIEATKMDEYADYRLALALNELHPRADGTNPHMIQTIKVVVNGNLLVTRYHYHITSPVAAEFVKKNLKRFLAGNLTMEKRKHFPYRISCTETIVAKALLGIRGIKHVEIVGEEKMEVGFAEALKATLIRSPGTAMGEAEDRASQISPLDMSGVQGDKPAEEEYTASVSRITGGFVTESKTSPNALKKQCTKDFGFIDMLKKAEAENLPLIVVGEEEEELEMGWSLEVKTRVKA